MDFIQERRVGLEHVAHRIIYGGRSRLMRQVVVVVGFGKRLPITGTWHPGELSLKLSDFFFKHLVLFYDAAIRVTAWLSIVGGLVN
jgi:hypothetical protein